MKRKPDSSWEVKTPVHLFKEELSAIQTILLDELHGSNLQITVKGFEVVSSLGEIPTDQPSTNGISFQTYRPYILVEIRRFGSRVYTAETSLEVQGGAMNILKILNNSPRWEVLYRKWVSNAMYVLAFLSGISLIVFIDTVKEFIPKPYLYFAVAFPFLCLVSWSQMFWPLQPIIEFQDRNKQKSFWERNKDQIILASGSAFIGALATTALAVIFKLI